MNFKRKKYIFLGVGTIILISSWAVLRNPDRCKNANVPGGFACYNIGTNISFDANGNSKNFIKSSDGWGGQEPKHRCAIGNNSVINLYIPNAKDKNLRLDVDAFGVWNPEQKYQKIEVYANDTKLTDWKMNDESTYSVDIPSALMTDNKISIRFHGLNPYTPTGDTRKISMAVLSVKIVKLRGRAEKQKIARWLKQQIEKLFPETEEEKKARQEQWNAWPETSSDF